MSGGSRRLRADAERSIQAILDAAENVLAADPDATMERIAAVAGVSRTTIHRRFATREALIAAMAASAVAQMHQAVERARMGTAPALVALHEATVGVLRVKMGRRFSVGHLASADPQTAQVHQDILDICDAWFRRAQVEGLIRADVDLVWARRVYYALIDETFHGTDTEADPDALAERVVSTLLDGVGTRLGQPGRQ